jgi:hypothetical protein
MVTKQRKIPMIRMTSASGHKIMVTTVGTVAINDKVNIHDVAVSSSAPANLISVSRIVAAGFNVVFNADGADVVHPKSYKVLLHFRYDKGLYVIKLNNGYKGSNSGGFEVKGISKVVQNELKRQRTPPVTKPNDDGKVEPVSVRLGGKLRPVQYTPKIPRKANKPLPARPASSTTGTTAKPTTSYMEEEEEADENSQSYLVLNTNSQAGRHRFAW